jgi:threonine dehydrogenase-like Zn-dependent dehydrogenase
MPAAEGEIEMPMRAFNFIKPRVLELAETPIPKVGDHEVLCRVRAVGICGTDLRTWEGTHWQAERMPMPPGGHGHETGCEVEEVGSGVAGIKRGDRVAGMDRGFAEYTKKVMDALSPLWAPKEVNLPIVCNELTFEQLTFTDPLACAVNCVVQSGVEAGGTVVVLGQGPVGLLITQLCTARNVTVLATEISELRLGFSKRFGARVYDAKDEGCVERILKDAGPANCVIETAASQATLLQAIRLVKIGGRILVFGANNEMVLPYGDLRKKGVEMRFPEATFDSQRKAIYWEEALRLMKHKEIDVDSIITHRMSLWDLPEIFENYDRENWAKVILTP